MSVFAKLWGRLADINPVTLKELRQLVRSRIMLWAMFLYPVLLLVVCWCVLAAELRQHDSVGDAVGRAYAMMSVAAGRSLTTGVCVPLGLLALVVIPVFTGIRLARESAPSRMDLQFTTALTAGDIVGGKLMGAFLMTLTFTALSLPFLTLAYLMRGIDLADIARLTLGLLASSLVSTTLAVAVGASARAPVSERILVLSLGCGAIGVLSLNLLLATTFIASSADRGAWLRWLFGALGVGVVVVFGRALAASNLMPAHTDCKRGLRLLEFVLVAAACATALVGPALTGEDKWVLGAVVSFYAMAAVAVMSVLRPPGITRGVAAQAPRRFLSRVLRFPFATTSASGALFALLLAVTSAASLAGGQALAGAWVDFRQVAPVAVSVFGEVVLVALALSFAFRLCRVRSGTYARGPVAVFAVFGILQTAGVLEAADVIPNAKVVFGYFAGLGDALDCHVRYGAAGLAAYLAYLVVEVPRTFRRYRRPAEAGAK